MSDTMGTAVIRAMILRSTLSLPNGGLLLAVMLVCFQFAFIESGVAQTVDSEGSVELKIENERRVIVVGQLKHPETAAVTVRVAGGSLSATPPMAGKTLVKDGVLVFYPKYPLRAGMKYKVSVRKTDESNPVVFSMEIPPTDHPRSNVEAIFPSSDVLPENTLKFYIQFTGPMRKGDIYRYVRIQKVGGGVVDQPFLEIEQEFWSRDSTRLTLLLDPGRIKRGLKPREDMGPIFESGKSYELVISGEWPDADGRKLGKDKVKRFKATVEDFDQPDPSKWRISPPKSGTKGELTIVFPASLDHSMLFRVIQIQDSNSNQVQGTVSVSKNETEWRFLPDQTWSAGIHTILIDSNLEDNAGNSIARQFDVDVFDKTEPSSANRVVELEFEVGK